MNTTLQLPNDTRLRDFPSEGRRSTPELTCLTQIPFSPTWKHSAKGWPPWCIELRNPGDLFYGMCDPGFTWTPGYLWEEGPYSTALPHWQLPKPTSQMPKSAV